MARKLISFDWALKRLLRSKANFDILEGFLSELLKEPIQILDILETESNKDERLSKLTRLDLKVKNQQQELILIEIQYDRELDFLQRVLYASSKAIVEHLQESAAYREVIKVISVNILFFNLGKGQDYIYHGSTHFTGLHTHDELELSPKQQQLFNKTTVAAIFPEYYLIKVNQFNDIATTPLDEWIYFLKNEEIKDEFKAQGLQKAKEALDVLKLPEAERKAYEQHQEDLHYQASMFFSSFENGRYEGRKEGHKEGRKEGHKEGEQKGRQAEKEQLAKTMKSAGEPLEKIAQYTGLSIDNIMKL
jgi:predicted transposase/invertase (TIGR01784 family)